MMHLKYNLKNDAIIVISNESVKYTQSLLSQVELRSIFISSFLLNEKYDLHSALKSFIQWEYGNNNIAYFVKLSSLQNSRGISHIKSFRFCIDILFFLINFIYIFMSVVDTLRISYIFIWYVHVKNKRIYSKTLKQAGEIILTTLNKINNNRYDFIFKCTVLSAHS